MSAMVAFAGHVSGGGDVRSRWSVGLSYNPISGGDKSAVGLARIHTAASHLKSPVSDEDDTELPWHRMVVWQVGRRRRSALSV